MKVVLAVDLSNSSRVFGICGRLFVCQYLHPACLFLFLCVCVKKRLRSNCLFVSLLCNFFVDLDDIPVGCHDLFVC